MSLPADASGRGAMPAIAGEPFLRAFLGSVVLLFAVRAAEPVFFGEGYYAGLSAHPFWIIVLLAAVQNGLFAGVATAAMAALMMDWPPRPVGADITAYYVELATMPVLWILTALVIGGFRQTQLREVSALHRDNARLSAMNEDLAEEILRMDSVVSRLELDAATGRLDAASRVPDPWRALRALGDADAEDLSRRLDEVAAALGLGEVAVLIEDEEGRLVPLHEVDWLASDFCATLAAESGEPGSVATIGGREGDRPMMRWDITGPLGEVAVLVARALPPEREGWAGDVQLDILTLVARQVEVAMQRTKRVADTPHADVAPHLVHPVAAAE